MSNGCEHSYEELLKRYKGVCKSNTELTERVERLNNTMILEGSAHRLEIKQIKRSLEKQRKKNRLKQLRIDHLEGKI